MDVRLETVDLEVEREHIRGTVLSPPSQLPAVAVLLGYGPPSWRPHPQPW